MEDQGFEFDEGIKPLYDLRILKHELFFRNVSDIGEHDIDSAVIQKKVVVTITSSHVKSVTWLERG